MNNPKTTLAPSTGSQPQTVAAGQPVWRRAARCSQPKAIPPNVAAVLTEMQDEALACMNSPGSPESKRYNAKKLLVLADLELRFLSTPEAGLPAGNTSVSYDRPQGGN